MQIEDMLESLGCTCVGPVAELKEAMKLASGDSCDCAILDVNIRGGNITPVVEVLLGQGVPLLLASGYGDSTLPANLATQMRLSKPYTSSQLEDCIGVLCNRVSELRGGCDLPE